MSALTFLENRKFWTCRTFLQRFQTAQSLLTSEREHAPKFLFSCWKKLSKDLLTALSDLHKVKNILSQKHQSAFFGEDPASWKCTYEDVWERKDFQILYLGRVCIFSKIKNNWCVAWLQYMNCYHFRPLNLNAPFRYLVCHVSTHRKLFKGL